MWYRTGTIDLTNGSTAVNGTGTSWILNASAGEALLAPDGKLYEIESVNSNTSLTIKPAYLGATAAGQAYVIVPTQEYIRSLAAQAAALVNSYSTIATNAGAGKFGDGTVSLPGITFTNDQDSGFYRIGANNVGLALNGAKVVDFATTGVSITGTLGSSGNFAVATNKFTVAAATGNTAIAGTLAVTGASSFSTNVGIGESNPLVRLHIAVTSGTATARIQSSTTSSPVAALELMRGTNTTFGADAYGDYRLKADGGNLLIEYGESGVTTERFSLSSTGLATFKNNIQVDGTSTLTGNVGIGGATSNSIAAYVRSSSLTGTGQVGVQSQITGTSVATTGIHGFLSFPATAATTYTASLVTGFYAANPTKGAGSTITNLHGVYIDDQTQGTNNYGVTSQVSSGANKWNIYASGTAANYLAGTLFLGGGNTTNRTFASSGFTHQVQLEGTSGSTSSIGLVRNSANSSAAYISFGKTRAASLGGVTAINSGDCLGGFDFAGADGAGLISAARLEFFADGTVSTGVVPGRAVLSTANSAGTLTEALRIDSRQNMGLGVTPSAWSTFKALQFSSTGSGWIGSFTSNNNLYVGVNNYYNGTNFLYGATDAASQYLQSSGAHKWNSTASGTAGAAITFTQVLAVEKDKSLALQGATSQTGTGISFPATQSASSDANTLDDYEEGTFTPTIIGLTTAGIGTYTTQVGRYTKIGNTVHFSIYMIWTAHTGTGNLRVSGLPFTSSAAANNFPVLSVIPGNIAMTAGCVMYAYINPNASLIVIGQTPTGGGANAQIPMDTAGDIQISGHYEV